jgi:hypothetical protein
MFACSSIYTPALSQNGFTNTKKARVLTEVNSLKAAPARQCFKLELKTECIQRWFTSNEIKRTTSTLSVSRDDCLSKACMNCEIANSYLPEACEVFTFGANIRSTQIIFGSDITVFVDKLGTYTYSGKTTTNDFFDMGGSYNSMVYFEKIPTAAPINTDVIFDPDTKKILILSEKIMHYWNGGFLNYMDESWYTYGTTLVSVADLSSSQPRILQTGQQTYAEFFIQAQLNVTEWYLNYLDCRLKTLSIAIAGTNQSLYDLGPGEVIEAEVISKYPCKTITTGKLVATDNCIRYHDGQNTYNVTNKGEATLIDVCTTVLRINKTHVLNINSPTTLDIRQHSFSLLSEEEEILKTPPSFTTDVTEIRNLIINAFRAQTANSAANSTTRTEVISQPIKPLSWIQGLTSSSTWGWINLLWILLSIMLIGYLLLYVAKPWAGLKKLFSKKPDEEPESSGIEILNT